MDSNSRSGSGAGKPNWPLLALCRWVLASCVVIDHLVGMGLVNGKLWDVITYTGGFSAVSGFLMISGFSIAHSYRTRPDGFLERRFWRIYPTYLVCFACAYLPMLFMKDAVVPLPTAGSEVPPANWWQPALHFFLLNGIFTPTMTLIGPAWSLASEWVYYLCTPLIARLDKRRLLWLMAISIAVYLFGCGIRILPPSAGWPLMPLYMIWIWLLGWMFYHYADRRWVQEGIVILPALLILMDFTNSTPLALWPIILVAGVFRFGHLVNVTKMQGNVFSWLGDLSFPLYLCHYWTLVYGSLLFPHIHYSLRLVSCVVMAAVILYVIDYPVRWYKKRSAPGRAPFETAAPKYADASVPAVTMPD